MRRHQRSPAVELRAAVEALPRRTREAMLRGIDANRIIVGAYVDPRSGGVCPMLAAHRNGGRTSVASLARAWDAYTGAKRPRRATRREVRFLRSLIERSLTREPLTVGPEALDVDTASIAELAAQIRAERKQLPAAPQTPRISIRRRPHDPYLDLLAIAERALADEGVWGRADEPEPVEPELPPAAGR